MKSTWIHRENRDKLLVFFNGWGMDERPFSFLESNSYDVLMLYDYRDFDKTGPFSPGLFEEYRTIYVTGWSYGVWISSFFKTCFPAEKTLFGALNGTGCPVDAEKGINPAIFQATLDGFSPALLERFYQNMFSAKDEYSRFCTAKPARKTEELKEELEYIKERLAENKRAGLEYFNQALISKADRIIFARNQKAFWEDEPVKWKPLDRGHFPFYKWESYDTMIKELFS